MIRSSGPAGAGDPERVNLLVEAILRERDAVLNRRRFRRRLVLWGGAAAAAGVLFITFWGLWKPGEEPPGKLADLPEIPSNTGPEFTEKAPPDSLEAVEAVLLEIQGRSGRSARRAARRAASRLRGRGNHAVDAIGKIAGKHRHLSLAAFEVLAALGTPPARDAIIQLIEGGPEPDVLRAISGRKNILTGEILERLCRSGSPGAWALARLAERSPARAARVFWQELERRGEDGFPAFLKALVAEIPPGLKSFFREVARVQRKKLPALLEDLGRTGDARAWPFLEAMLPALELDPAFLAACGRIGAARSVPHLEKALRLADRRSLAAIEALEGIHTPEAVLVLYGAWNGQRSSSPGLLLHNFIKAAIWNHGDLAVNTISRIAREGPAQRTAIQALVEIFPDRAANVLVNALEESRPDVQIAMVGALGRLRDPAAAEALIRLLENPRLRNQARRSLRQLAGADLGSSPSAWRDWWKEYREREDRNAALLKEIELEAT